MAKSKRQFVMKWLTAGRMEEGMWISAYVNGGPDDGRRLVAEFSRTDVEELRTLRDVIDDFVQEYDRTP